MVFNTPFSLLALFISTIVSFVMGFLWYGPLFGRIWAKEQGIKITGNEKMPKINLLYQLITIIITVFTIYLISSGNLIIDLILILIIWFGIIVTDGLATRIWVPKSWTLFLIDSTYHLIRLLLIVIIINML